jgi:hypothetical protein
MGYNAGTPITTHYIFYKYIPVSVGRKIKKVILMDPHRTSNAMFPF